VAEIIAPKKKQSFTVNVISINLVKANIRPLKYREHTMTIRYNKVTLLQLLDSKTSPLLRPPILN